MLLSITSMTGFEEQESNDSRLEHEVGRNVEVMWLLGRLDHCGLA